MENNPAYGSVQKYTVSQAPTADNTYEPVDLPATKEACAGHSKKNTAGNHEIVKVDKTPQERSIVGVVAAIVAVLALVVAIAAITTTVVLSQTDNSNQEIQILQMEIENLREMLNHTGDNSKPEIQTLQLENDRLEEMLKGAQQRLNQTTMMVEELGNQISTLQTNTRTQNSECIHEIQYRKRFVYYIYSLMHVANRYMRIILLKQYNTAIEL